jgi:hypothetical protein
MTAFSIILFTVLLMLVLMAGYPLVESDRFKHRLEWARECVPEVFFSLFGFLFLIGCALFWVSMVGLILYAAFSLFEAFLGPALAILLVVGTVNACLMHGFGWELVMLPFRIIEDAGDLLSAWPLTWEEKKQFQKEREQAQKEREQARDRERDQKKQEILSAKESGWSRVEIKAMLLRNRPLKERPEVLYRWKHRGTDRETLTRLATILPVGSPERRAALADIRRPWTGWSDWTVPSENTQGFVIGHSDLFLTGGALSWKRDYRVEVNGAPYVLGSKLPEAGFSLAVWGSDPLFCHVLFNRVESPLRDHAHNLEDSPSEQPPTYGFLKR